VSEKIITHGQLEIYRKAFETALVIFELSRKFPREETYSLTDVAPPVPFAQTLRRPGKRRYEAAFISKLHDVEAEAAETQTWLEFALACGYIKREVASPTKESSARWLV